MSSSRPYIVRSLYQWILDNECTPYVLVDAGAEGVEVPQQYVQDGQIVLNVSPGAVMELHIGNDAMSFRGRFGGIPVDVLAPTHSILGIYARENGQGMIFDREESPKPPPPDPGADKPASRPSLKVVK